MTKDDVQYCICIMYHVSYVRTDVLYKTSFSVSSPKVLPPIPPQTHLPWLRLLHLGCFVPLALRAVTGVE